MIRTDQEYWITLRQWHRVWDIAWPIIIRRSKLDGRKDESAGLYQRWSHKVSQLDVRLQKYEKTQPKGWRGGRKNARYLAEVRRKMRIVSQKYPSPQKGSLV